MNCHQLQYWREKGVVVPTVNPSGKGRNVYYSPTDLLALTVMEYLLSMGLSFEVCQEMLETLKATESWLFQPSVLEGQRKRFMLLLDLKRRCLVNFDSGLALETINRGLPVVPFWSDRIHQRLRENLRSFER
ncbi:MerR family transcriptional regulator [Microcoleus sp.]|uniref:MerR family transcriptional regulator n=1 Tax=Microcoleus sp. TaxID=44472 RepID=UPI003523E72F